MAKEMDEIVESTYGKLQREMQERQLAVYQLRHVCAYAIRGGSRLSHLL